MLKPALTLGPEHRRRCRCRQTEQSTQRRLQSTIGPAAQQIGITAEVPTEGQRGIDGDVFIEIEATEQEVEEAVIVGGDPSFLRVGVDAGLAAVATDQIGAGEVRIGIALVADVAIGTDADQ